MIENCSIMIRQTIEQNGTMAFTVNRLGDVPMSTWIGLLELAKDAILREYNQSLEEMG